MKKLIKVLSFGLVSFGMLSGSLFVKTSVITSVGENEAKVYFSDFYEYDSEELNVTDYYSPSEKGIDTAKTGVLFSTVNSGTAAEGASIKYKSILNGNFSTEFRVFSKKNYKPADESYAFTPYVSTIWNQRILDQTSDAYNPYLDLKEVSYRFTSKLDSTKWFEVFFRGGHQEARCDTVSASVLLSTDNDGVEWNQRGYGLHYDAYTVEMWQIGRFTQLTGSGFSNRVVNAETSSPVSFAFDPTTMNITALSDGQYVNVRHMSTNEGLNDNGFTQVFGTLEASDFAGGYEVEIFFNDITEDDFTCNISETTFSNCECPYADLTEQYKRYGNMVIYSVNDVDYAAQTGVVTDVTEAIVADGVTLDAEKFTGGKTAVKLSSTKSGTDAIGTTFTLKETFDASEELVFDFRVFSQKGYKAINKTAINTHDYPYNDPGHPSQAASLYSSDYFNPYMDLKEVTITISSAIDPSVWIKCMIRGGAAGRADLSTARVLTCYDEAVGMGWVMSEDGVGKQRLYGYGQQCDSDLPAWPTVSWDSSINGTRYTELSGAFSNNVVTGTSTGSLIKFSPQAGGYDFAGMAGTYYRSVRDCVSNWAINEGGRAYGYKDMPANLLAGGYNVSFTFSDVTDDKMTAGDISNIHTFNNPAGGYSGGYYVNPSLQYEHFSQAYKRYANMVIYGITVNGQRMDLSSDSFCTKRDVITTADFNTSITQAETVDVTPTIKDVVEGVLPYNGHVNWTNVATEETGEILPNEQGRYIFKPTAEGKYRIDYTNSLYSLYYPSCEFSIYVNVTKVLKIKYLDEKGNELFVRTCGEGEKMTFEDYKPSDTGKQFIGWEYDDGIYPAGYEVYAKTDITIKAVTIDFALDGGRKIRYTNSVSYKYGMTQDVKIDQSKLDSFIKNNNVRKVYGYVIPTDMFSGELNPSTDGLVIATEFKEGKSTFGISNIKGYNFNRDFAFMSYFSFKYSDGTSKIIKTAYDPNAHVSNIYQLAKDTYNDSLTELQKRILNYYINGVISFTQTSTTISCDDTRVKVNSAKLIDNVYYDVNITVNDDLYKYLKEYTVGSSISLYVNSVRKPGTITVVNNKTFTIRYEA